MPNEGGQLMSMDAIFSCAWVYHVLSSLPPQLAADVEKLAQARGFEILLVSLVQNQDALKHLHKALRLCCQEAKEHGQELNKTRQRIIGRVTLGNREMPR